MFKKRVKIEDNFLDFIPVRKVDWEQDEKGKVCLLNEKTKNKFIKKIIGLFNKSQHIHIHLDELGTSAWLLIDGKRTVQKINEKMKGEFGEELTHSQQRLVYFFVLLKKNKFIGFS